MSFKFSKQRNERYIKTMINQENISQIMRGLIASRVIANQATIAAMTGSTSSYVSQVMNKKVIAGRDFISRFIEGLEKNGIAIEKEVIVGNENVNAVKVLRHDMSALALNPNDSVRRINDYGKNTITIPFVNQYAFASYLRGYENQTYMNQLETRTFTVTHEPRGNYLSFEVKGDSMDNGTKQSICDGDIVLVREVTSDLWQYKLHLHKWRFVVVHKTEGILIKEISAHNTETHEITLHSLNSEYPDMVVSLNDVAQLFSVVKIEREQ
jgi:SOS-response transcriptional repressor LexA